MDKKGEAIRIVKEYLDEEALKATGVLLPPYQLRTLLAIGALVDIVSQIPPHDGLAMDVKHKEWCSWFMNKVCTCGELKAEPTAKGLLDVLLANLTTDGDANVVGIEETKQAVIEFLRSKQKKLQSHKDYNWSENVCYRKGIDDLIKAVSE